MPKSSGVNERWELSSLQRICLSNRLELLLKFWAVLITPRTAADLAVFNSTLDIMSFQLVAAIQKNTWSSVNEKHRVRGGADNKWILCGGEVELSDKRSSIFCSPRTTHSLLLNAQSLYYRVNTDDPDGMTADIINRLLRFCLVNDYLANFRSLFG